MEYCIMTFNIKVDAGVQPEHAWNHRCGRVVEMIQKWEPEIVCTQEGLYRTLEDIKKGLPGYQYIGEGRRGKQEDEYCAILYKKKAIQVLEQGQFWLSETPEEAGSISWNSSLPRICTWGLFQSKEEISKKFLVFNTHLDHMSQEAREKGVQLIYTKIEAMQQQYDLPVILTGDMNANPTNPVIQFLRGEKQISGAKSKLKDSYLLTGNNPKGTFHNFQGILEDGPIDYIMVSDTISVQHIEIDRNRMQGDYPSDHYPVIAKVSF